MTIAQYADDWAVTCDVPSCPNEVAGATQAEAEGNAGLLGYEQRHKLHVCNECMERARMSAHALNLSAAHVQAQVAARNSGGPHLADRAGSTIPGVTATPEESRTRLRAVTRVLDPAGCRPVDREAAQRAVGAMDAMLAGIELD